MGRKTKSDGAPGPGIGPAAAGPPAPPAPPGADQRSGPRFLRIFLMVAGGLAAPCLALAAFFLTSSGDDAAPKRAQPGRVTTTTARPQSSQQSGSQQSGSQQSASQQSASATTTTTAPAVVSAAGLRDPFAPLVK